MTIAVSGATGQIGGRVARLLDAAGESQRLVLRDPSRSPVAGVETAVIKDYADFDALVTALRGTGPVLMISGMEAVDRLDQHKAFVDAAVAAGVDQLVYTSYFGAGPTATFSHGRLHFATEEYIKASGLGYTFLRDNLYADFLGYLAGDDGVIRGPAGSGRLSAVAQDDVAEVAATVLRNPAAHAGRTYDLTGPESFSLAEIAALLTETLGKPIRYVDETLDEAYASRASYNAEPWLVDAWVSTYTAIAAGEMAAISGDVELVTGRRATSLETVLARRAG